MRNVTLQAIQVPPSSGLQKTLELMSYLEKLSFQDPTFVKFVHEKFSNNCMPCIPGKIWKYVNENFEFKHDSPFDEILIAPYLMLDMKAGDCDDFSLFIKTCLDILGGFYTKYILFGVNKNEWSHVAVFCYRGVTGSNYIDPVVIDGANNNFNIIPAKYKFFKLI